MPVQAQVKRQFAQVNAPAAVSQLQAPVQHKETHHQQQPQERRALQERTVNQLDQDPVTVKKEIDTVKLETREPELVHVLKSATKRVFHVSTVESVLPLLEGEEEAIAHEEEENRKRPKHSDYEQWDEVDEDRDPLMVSEYAEQIFGYMLELEVSIRERSEMLIAI